MLDEIGAFQADLVVATTETGCSLVRGVAGSVAGTPVRKAPVTVVLVLPAR
jgi:hypothetical protein